MLTVHKTHNPKVDVDRLYEKGEKEEEVCYKLKQQR